MIYWLATARHLYPIRRHFEAFGGALAERVTPLSYDELDRTTEAPRGVYVFTDIERLSRAERDSATAWSFRLQGEGARVLNHPGSVLLRCDLLRGLAEMGLNDFDVARVDEGEWPQQYPVFLRCENDHRGARTALLPDRAALEAAIADHCRSRFCFRDEHGKFRLWRSGAQRRRELLVTEFCDTKDSAGVYRKYAAFCVGGRIVPRHLFFGREWMLKGPSLKRADLLAEERAYVAENPHREQLERVFRFAGIDYGRVDYGLRDGRVRVWEINTNPMITAPADLEHEERFPVQRGFTARFADALLSLDTPQIAVPRRRAA